MYNQFSNFGLRDKVDQGTGFVQVNPNETRFTSLENTIIIDTRDCVGEQSLRDAQTYAISIGKRGPASGRIISVTGLGTYPPVITFDSVTNLQNGDTIIIQGVNGNGNINGPQVINNIAGNTAEISTSSNGNYTGGGVWNRMADSGYPVSGQKEGSYIKGNELQINLQKNLKQLRSMTLQHIVIPRDIIPLTTYLSDFVSVSTTYTNVTYVNSGVVNSYITFIPQEQKYLESRMLGFYSSPMDIYRSYSNGNFSPPDQVTPPPLQLWNPPNTQPVSYPFQTVPTYRSSAFFISANPYYLVLSGYGVYDLVDWTARTGNATADRITTTMMRRLLLLLIVQKQSYQNVDYIDMILACDTTSNNDVTQAFGFGNFQRYIPGPGLGQTYQPNTNGWYTNGGAGSGPPNVVQTDSPIPFPNFFGNVWGPYGSPGDRFQKLGLRSTIQDLFLNGDLNNLNGFPIVLPEVPTVDIPNHPMYGLNFGSIIEVNLGNVSYTENLNILNAMRIIPNGYGAASIRATGNGTTYVNRYESAGGQGPSSLGAPSAWINTGVYGGAASFADPVAQGPAASGTTVDSATPAADPTNRISFYDSGPNNGAFIGNVLKYINFVVNEIPDTDLIMRVEESLRDDRCQSTRSINGDALLDCPIRLNIGSTSGTLQYIESLQSLVGNANSYWDHRYFNPKTELSRLIIKFYTYEGDPIQLEKMLQYRNSSEFLQLFVRVIQDMNLDINNTPFVNFLFDPLNPQLMGRVKRYIQMILKVQTYEGTPPGNQPNSFSSFPSFSRPSNYS